MDNLTHTLTGLMLARAGVAKGVPRAGLLLMVAANAPDFDVVSWFGGPLLYLRWHRAITHAIIAAPVMGAISVLIAWLAARRKPFPWPRAILAATAGVASHLLLDFTNVYGIRLLLPFDASWLRLDITNIVDVWLWAILLVAVAAPALAKLVSSEIGARSDSRKAWAIAALVLMFAYEYARFLAHERAVAVLNARVYNNAAPVRVAAFPMAWSLARWRGLVETADAYRFAEVDLLTGNDASGATPVFKPEASPAIVAAQKNPDFQEYLRFNAFPWWRVDGADVELSDLRFGTPQHPGFVMRGKVEPDGIGSPDFRFGSIRPR